MSNYKEQNNETADNWNKGYIQALDEVFKVLNKIGHEQFLSMKEVKLHIAKGMGFTEEAMERFKVD